jgi:hypothetical protein
MPLVSCATKILTILICSMKKLAVVLIHVFKRFEVHNYFEEYSLFDIFNHILNLAYVLFVVRCLLFYISHSLLVICHLSCVLHLPSFVVCHMHPYT